MSILDLFCAEGIGATNEYFSAVYSAAKVLATSGGRRGNQSFVLSPSGAEYPDAKKIFADKATAYAGTAWMVDKAPEIAEREILSLIDDATVQVAVFLCSTNGITGFLKVKNGDGTTLGTGTAVIEVGKWYYLEFKGTINETTGSVEVRVNGSTDISVTGADTQNSANATVNTIQWKAPLNYPAKTYFMDAYITDSAFLGDIRLDVAPVTADSATYADFTPSTGTDHYAVVDEDPPSTSDYVESGTVGHIDTYDVTLAALGTAIHAVQLQVYANKTDAGARGLSPTTYSTSGTSVASPEWDLNETPDYYSHIFETDPDDSQPWTETKIANHEFGFKVTT